MFEYQTAISELTALPVSNASVYEGPSAVAAAAYIAKLHNGRGRIVVSAGLHPHSIATLRTYARGYGMEVLEVPLRDGVTDAAAWSEAIDADTSAAVFAEPNFYGAVEDTAGLASRQGGPRRRRPVLVAQVDPIALGRPAKSAGSWPSARARRSAAGSLRRPSPRARGTCGGCPGASRAPPSTSTGAAAFVSRCRPAAAHPAPKATSNICAG
jgi:hypothetical protein